MEDWSKDLLVAIEDVANGVEKFFTDLSEEFAQVVDEWEELSTEISRELESDHLFNQINQYLTELLEPIVELYADFDEDLDANNFDQNSLGQNFVTYLEPDQQTHPACRGCENYHGQVYGGNLLVCAMHPHGVESDQCPDWSDRN